MDNSINFKAAVVLKQPTPRIQRMIKSSLGKHHQILENFSPEGDVLYVVRRGKDRAVAEFLRHRQTEFEFYTDLSTRSGFDDEKPIEARQILDNYKSKIITTADELIEHFGLGKSKHILPFIIKRVPNRADCSVIALGYNLSESNIINRNGYSDVFNKDNKLIARISDPGKYGISFAFKYIDDKTTQRFAIRGKEIIFTFTGESGRTQFLKNYNNAVRINKKKVEV